MTVLAGAITGLLMSCVFIGHAALVLVFYTPQWLLERAKDEDTKGLSRAIVWGAGLAVPVWAALGVAAALLLTATAGGSSDVSSSPTPVYLGVILGLVAFTAPIAVMRMRSIKWHLVVDYAVFLVLFLILLPWLVSVA